MQQRPEWRLLAGLADPDRGPPPLDTLEPRAVGRVLVAARSHGVLPIVCRKLRASGFAATPLEGDARTLLEQFDRRVVNDVGQTMLLQHHGQRVMARFAEAGLAATIIKGPVFAERLYRNRADRYFSDIDILVEAGGMERAGAIMAESGFELEGGLFDTSARKQEFQWLLAGNRSVLIELHGNLVHYRALRHRVSLDYARLGGVSDIAAQSAVALLIIAIVHASCGHKFHRLLFLVDVLQAARALSPRELPEFEMAARKLGIELEAATTLHATASLFGDGKVMALASRFDRRLAPAIGRRLITPEAIVDASPKTTVPSRLRRHAFRWLQLSPLARL
ncbi:MAG: nucleotidyltransferase family protein [Bauldia sp.]